MAQNCTLHEPARGSTAPIARRLRECKRRYLQLAAWLLGTASVAAGQEPVPAPPLDSGSSVDEVIVRAKSLTRLQNEAFRAEEAFYAAFNGTTGNHEFDIHCERRSTSGGKILERVCLAKFVETLEAEAARAFWSGAPLPQTGALMREKASS